MLQKLIIVKIEQQAGFLVPFYSSSDKNENC